MADGEAVAHPKAGGAPVLFALLAAFVAIRVAAIWFVPLTPTADCAWYFDRAIGIAHGLGYTVNGVPTAFYPVGYPLFLGGLFALFGDHLWVGQAANVVIGVGVCLLIYRVSMAIFGDRVAATVAVALFTFYPNQIGYTPGLMTEVLYPFLILLAFAILFAGQRFVNLFLFGLIMGLATLIKSQTLLLPLIVCGGALLLELKWSRVATVGRGLAIMYLGLVITVAPWTARNYVAFGRFVPVSTNDGVDLLNGNNPGANGDVAPDDVLKTMTGGDILGPTPATEIASELRTRELAMSWIENNPLRAIALMPKKIWRLWGIDGDSEWAYRAGSDLYQPFVRVFRALRWINQGYYMLMVAATGGALVMLWRRGALFDAKIMPSLVMAAYTTLLAMVFSGQARYHHFLTPWMVMYAGWLVSSWSLRVKRELPALGRRAVPSP